MKTKRNVYLLRDCEIIFGVFSSKKKAIEHAIKKKLVSKRGDELFSLTHYSTVCYPRSKSVKNYLLISKRELR